MLWELFVLKTKSCVEAQTKSKSLTFLAQTIPLVANAWFSLGTCSKFMPQMLRILDRFCASYQSHPFWVRRNDTWVRVAQVAHGSSAPKKSRIGKSEVQSCGDFMRREWGTGMTRHSYYGSATLIAYILQEKVEVMIQKELPWTAAILYARGSINKSTSRHSNLLWHRSGIHSHVAA